MIIKVFKTKNEKQDFNNKGFKQYQNYFGRMKKGNCMFRGCTANAIKSHAISKNSSLNLISSNGDSMTIKSRRNSDQWEMKFVNEHINDATTFAGFCVSHDNSLFCRLDRGLMETWLDVYQQCYRSISHQVYCQAILEHINSQQTHHWVEKLLHEDNVIIPEGSSFETFEREFRNLYNIQSTKRLEKLRRMEFYRDGLLHLMETNEEIKEMYINDSIATCYYNLNSAVFYKKIPFLIPSAIVNSQSLSVNNDVIDLHYTLIPSVGCSHLIIFNSNYSTYSFYYDFTDIIKDDISILNFVESIMMSDEKYWYIDPRIVNSMPESRKKMIEQDMYCVTERKFRQSYDISIFDNVRCNLLDGLDKDMREKEKMKMVELPYRECFEKRKSNVDKRLDEIWLGK